MQGDVIGWAALVGSVLALILWAAVVLVVIALYERVG